MCFSIVRIKHVFFSCGYLEITYASYIFIFDRGNIEHLNKKKMIYGEDTVSTDRSFFFYPKSAYY